MESDDRSGRQMDSRDRHSFLGAPRLSPKRLTMTPHKKSVSLLSVPFFYSAHDWKKIHYKSELRHSKVDPESNR